MVKCDCWMANGHRPYCNGTREQDYCTCGGDRSKCDFYEDVREKAILAAVQKYNESSRKAVIPFQWKSMDEAPEFKTNQSIKSDVLVCYLDKGEPRYKTFKFTDRFNMENSFIARHAVAWCYIEQPKNFMSKEEAIKNLQNAGILDKDGNLVPIYESILVKVDDL